MASQVTGQKFLANERHAGESRKAGTESSGALHGEIPFRDFRADSVVGEAAGDAEGGFVDMRHHPNDLRLAAQHDVMLGRLPGSWTGMSSSHSRVSKGEKRRSVTQKNPSQLMSSVLVSVREASPER